MRSKSLKIIPLQKEDLALYLMEEDLYEQKYQLDAWGRTVPTIVKEMMVDGLLPGIDLVSPQQYYFYTLWIAIDIELESIVAEFQLKGLPDDKGFVEIGYETFAEYQKKGYMYEIIQYMMEWARNNGVKGFWATTHQNNTASIQLLKKLGFRPTAQKNHFIDWKISFI